ncbi:MAG TPA: trypsin-like peptidase domain-containing protein [Solirubrobacterales bacterium]|nr:trypsin-like peptidase domain-containing protein [Solirubrobacterales bacterium]
MTYYTPRTPESAQEPGDRRSRLSRIARSPFASAAIGGLVVGLLGWIAIAAGWIEAESGSSGDTALSPAAPLATSSSDDGERNRLSVNEIYEGAAPGVAFIRASSSGSEADPDPFNPFEDPQPGQAATGSGFLIDDDGRVVTNAHVVDDADEIEVTLGEDGETYDAELLGADLSTDVAVLEIEADADQLSPLALGDSTAVEVGDPVVAIGNPFGLDHTATAGIVSAIQREIRGPDGFTIRDAIQIDAPINPGNSGGPLLDASGRVIGINSQIQSPSGGNVGIGFAVPISTGHEVAQQLIETGEVQHAFLGISGADLTPEIAQVLNLEHDSGALVQQVDPGTPADEAGIEAGDAVVTVGGTQIRVGGDLIIAVDGEEVEDMGAVIEAIQAKQPGDEIELTLHRDGDERTVTVELTARPGQDDEDDGG